VQRPLIVPESVHLAVTRQFLPGASKVATARPAQAIALCGGSCLMRT
jgi:hypothetical protein